MSDHEIKMALSQRGIECHTFNADLLYEPWEVTDTEGKPYTCYEDFWAR